MAALLSSRNYDPARMMEKVQVLIVNQSKEVAHLLKNILSVIGFRQSYTTEDAVSAVRYLKEVKINIIITDSELRLNQQEYALPSEAKCSLRGSEFVRSLRQSKTLPNPYVSIIILAEEMNEKELIEARDSGVNGVVLRPLQAHQLCQSLRDIIESPRRFVVSEAYRGPCRRKRQLSLAMPDRRKTDICVFKNKNNG